MGPSSLTSQDFGCPIPIQVGSPQAHIRILPGKDHLGGQRSPISTRDDPDFRAFVLSITGDDVRESVSVHIPHGNLQALGAGFVGIKNIEIADLSPVGSIEDPHPGTATLAGSNRDIGPSIQIDIPGRDTEAIPQVGLVQCGLPNQSTLQTTPNADFLRTAALGSRHDIGETISVDISYSDGQPIGPGEPGKTP